MYARIPYRITRHIIIEDELTLLQSNNLSLLFCEENELTPKKFNNTPFLHSVWFVVFIVAY